jgi:hypothetical protein
MALETKKNLVGKMVPNAVPKSQKKEKEREDNAWKKKLFGYFEGFKKSFKYPKSFFFQALSSLSFSFF